MVCVVLESGVVFRPLFVEAGILSFACKQERHNAEQGRLVVQRSPSVDTGGRDGQQKLLPGHHFSSLSCWAHLSDHRLCLNVYRFNAFGDSTGGRDVDIQNVSV